MVCKEDVVTWFQRLTADRRVEVMCSLINMFLPYEVRFFGTCLEDIGKQDFLELRDAEQKANNLSNLQELQCIRDKRVQRLLVLTVSLLQSCNHKSSNGIFKILEKLDCSELNVIINTSPPDENPLEELLLLYTLALHHPAFTFEQKSVCGNILLMLQNAANNRSRLSCSNSQSVHMGMGIPLVYNTSTMQPCPPCPVLPDELAHPDSLPPCIPVHAVPVPDLPTRGPPPLLAPVIDAGNYLPLGTTYVSPSHQPVPWPPVLVPVEQPSDLQRLVATEMSSFPPSLQQYTIKEAMVMSDEELNNLGMSSSAIAQLRGILAKYKKSNGISNQEKLEPTSMGRRKHDKAVTEVSGVMRGMVLGPPQCVTCFSVPRVPCVGQQLRDLRLQPASTSSSASQSPPDTPTPPMPALMPLWDKDRLCGKEMGNEDDRGDLASDTAGLVTTVPWRRAPPTMMEAQPMNGLASRTSQPPPMQENMFVPPPYPPQYFTFSLRPNYPYHYQPPAFGPPNYPPPAPSCYNCGAGHLGNECLEATMEEVERRGQYHLDYTPQTYTQPSECSSDK